MLILWLVHLVILSFLIPFQIKSYERHELSVGGRKNLEPYDFDYFFSKTTAQCQ